MTSASDLRTGGTRPEQRLVVTGICGFIGSHLAEALLRHQGAQVLGVDRLAAGDDPRTAPVLKELAARSGLTLLSADAGDALVAAALGEASAVVHLAAPTDVAASWGAFVDRFFTAFGPRANSPTHHSRPARLSA